jgi:radical SAM enzyme (TIGR01210 family)
MAGAPPPARRPALVEVSSASVRGRPGLRMMLVLRAPGCRYAQQTGGCTNCGFWQHMTTGGRPVAAGDLVAQLRRALTLHAQQVPRLAQLDLFCSGSFFCDGEIPPGARARLLSLAAQLPALRALLVESRPEYITDEALEQALLALGPGRAGLLEVAIGLESADRVIREERIRKGFSLEDFEAAAGRMAAAGGVGLLVYLLLKPAGTGEAEALRDVLRSGRYLAGLGRRLALPLRVALEPAFVPEDTDLQRELLAGRYTPPSLWTALRAARGLADDGLTVHVGLSSEGLPADHVASGCPECTPALRRALALFNETQDPASLAGLSCACGGHQG